LTILASPSEAVSTGAQKITSSSGSRPCLNRGIEVEAELVGVCSGLHVASRPNLISASPSLIPHLIAPITGPTALLGSVARSLWWNLEIWIQVELRLEPKPASGVFVEKISPGILAPLGLDLKVHTSWPPRFLHHGQSLLNGQVRTRIDP